MAEQKEKRYVSDNAQLMAEWDWEKNTALGLNPNSITWKSDKKAWWICTVCKNSWEAAVKNRSNGRGCPKCSKTLGLKKRSQNRIRNYGSLATENPLLAKQWHPTKNGVLTPFDVNRYSNRKAWWKCSHGHEWQAQINSRNKGNGCPFCAGQKVLKGYNDLQTLNPDLAKEWHYEKNDALTPADVSPGSDKKVWWKCRNGHEWQETIAHRNRGDNCPFCSNHRVLVGFNDLFTTNPNLKSEWNFQKNTAIDPLSITAGSDRKAWWKCRNGHEWQATIASRNNGAGCPYCSGRVAIKGENDLLTVNPDLAKEWNFEKNVGLAPSDVLPNCSKKVWWKCSKGHEWQATVNHRNNGRSCPICKTERKTSFPEYIILYYLAKYGLDAKHLHKENGYELDIYIPSIKVAIEYDGYFWHKNKIKQDLEKNQKCAQDRITLYRLRESLPSLNDSSKDFIVDRYQNNIGIIIQSILSEIIGTDIDVNLKRDSISIENLRIHTEKNNSILFTSPEIVREWNYEKNGKLKPENFSAGSAKKFWWKCSRGHEWQATIASRNNGHGCPYCSGRLAIKGETDLKTVNPALANEWNYDKNGELKPENFKASSSKKVWWRCNQGHEWQAVIYSRNNGTGCPYCSGNKVLKGYNDLQTVNPTLAKEWNYEKNNGLSPADVTPNSDQKVWWKCKNGHEWQASIGHRNHGRGCPYCSKISHSKILNVETGEIFKTYSEASKKYKISVTSISDCCKEKQKTAGDYHWKYVTEE